jgi:hypothetical protein
VIDPSLLTTRRTILERIGDAFRQRDKDYDAQWKPLNKRLEGLMKELEDQQSAGHAMECSTQHALEATWLINYTDEWPRVGPVLDELELSLKNPDQPRLVQDSDGSWGLCCHEWYRKLEPTVDALQEKEAATEPLWPLAFMASLEDPAIVIDRLERLRISDIVATGLNQRDEQGAMLTALCQIIFKDRLRKLFVNRPQLQFTVSQQLEEKFTKYLWNLQDARTGYWGPAYKFDDGDVTVQDLSYTFHVVHYFVDGSGRKIPNMDKVVATTLAIKDQVYPNGWKNKKLDYTDHNNYDVVTLFACGWDAASAGQRSDMQREIQALADWCLIKSLKGDHFGRAATIDSYYYGVRFLDGIGLWNPAKRFWRADEIPLPAGSPPAAEIAKRLLAGFKKIDDGSEYAETIGSILEGGGPPPIA